MSNYFLKSQGPKLRESSSTEKFRFTESTSTNRVVMNTDDMAQYYAISTYYTIEKRHYSNGVAYAVVKHLNSTTRKTRDMQVLETYESAERLINHLISTKKRDDDIKHEDISPYGRAH